MDGTCSLHPCWLLADTKFQCNYPEADRGSGSGQCVEVRGLAGKAPTELLSCSWAAPVGTARDRPTGHGAAGKSRAALIDIRDASHILQLNLLQCNTPPASPSNDCEFLVDHAEEKKKYPDLVAYFGKYLHVPAVLSACRAAGLSV